MRSDMPSYLHKHSWETGNVGVADIDGRIKSGHQSVFPLLPFIFDDAAHAAPGTWLHDIEIAVRVDPDAVARAIGRAVPPAREAPAIEGENADHAAIVFGDINGVVVIDIEEGRADQLGRPDGQ